MTDAEALALDQFDIVAYNGREWLVVACFGREGHVRTMRLACAYTDTYIGPHKVTFVRKGNGRLDYAQLEY